MPSTRSTLWLQYCDHIRTWFYEPDLECLRILAANLYAHTHLEDPPAWIFLVGPSGSGKTTIGIYPFETIPRTFTISDITPAGFFSTDKSRRTPVHHGLLVQAGNPGNAIWLFKDFTTVISKDHHTFGEVMSRLREIHDGKFSRDIGQIARVPWTGKITCHIACTSSIEQKLASSRDFGERFLILRWPAPADPMAALAMARRQNGHQNQVRMQSQNLLATLISSKPTIPPDSINFSSSVIHQLDSLAWLAMKISREGTRDSRHHLMTVGEESFPSRIVQSVHTILRGHCLLFDRSEPGPEELSLAYRLVLDTIPARRMTLLRHIPLDGSIITLPDLLTKTSSDPIPVPKTALKEDLEVLEHIGLLNNIDNIIAWTKPFRKLITDAGLATQLTQRQQSKIRLVS